MDETDSEVDKVDFRVGKVVSKVNKVGSKVAEVVSNVTKLESNMYNVGSNVGNTDMNGLQVGASVDEVVVKDVVGHSGPPANLTGMAAAGPCLDYLEWMDV